MTHDVCLIELSSKQRTELTEHLSRTINLHVDPLPATEWRNLFETCGFKNRQKIGEMTLMKPAGLIKDEGLGGTLRIIKNGLKKENRTQFLKMFKFFNGYKQYLCYIANYSQKPVKRSE